MISEDIKKAKGHLLDSMLALFERNDLKAIEAASAALDCLVEIEDAFEQNKIASIEAAIRAAQAKVITLIEQEALKAVRS
jgi:hypothetical protein